jgi:cbb3-type cytochrome oxidase maturation protein
MDILFLLIPLSVVLAFCIGWFFWRAVDTGQFDDLDTPALAILADDDKPRPAEPHAPAPKEAAPKSNGA